MARSKQHGVTLQHTQYADEIVAWLKLTGAPPLEIGVVEEIRDRLKEHAKNGAIVRVRLANRGNPKMASVTRERHDRNAYDRRVRVEQGSGIRPLRNWQVYELDTLERMCRERATIEEIRERLPHRSHQAIKTQLSRMGIQARHVYGGGGGTHRGGGVLARARALREERLTTGRMEREIA